MTKKIKLHKNILRALSFAVLLAAASCGKDDSEPSAPTTVEVTGVTLNKTTMSLVRGRTETLTATVAPENATNKTVNWTTNNEQVATVSGGVVTAVATGAATITVTTADGNRTATCAVTVTNPEYDVYAAGYITIGTKQTAAYWKNGQLTTVDNPAALGGTLNDIAVTGGNVHLLGAEVQLEGTSTYNVYAKYWLNGNATQIGGVNSIPNRMEVVNSDVHIVGSSVISGVTTAKYWKNGMDMNLNGANKIIATDISIYGNKYYISGNDGSNAAVWENSTIAKRFDYDPGQGEQVDACALSSIYAYGDNEYVYGGHADVQGQQWGFMSGVSVSGYTAVVTSVYRHNGVNYGAGHMKSSATSSYKAILLTQTQPMQTLSTNNAEANAVMVVDGDVYVGGSENDVAVYWKNGTKVTLTGAESAVNAIYVVERP
jgi:hypothetical protein